MATDRKEILVLPFLGLGHMFPFIELCKHLVNRDCKITLMIPSILTSSIHFNLTVDYPLIQVVELPSSVANVPPPPPEQGVPLTDRPMDPFHLWNQEMEHGIVSFLSARLKDSKQPDFVVIDTMMSWTQVTFAKFGIPTVSFLTSGACFAAMEYAMWKARVTELKPGESTVLPGLPVEMIVSYEEINKNKPPPPPDMPPNKEGKSKGPFRLGEQPPWFEVIQASIAMLINTCNELEPEYLDYLAAHIEKPVWGVGPLLPEQYWRSSAGSILLHDKDFRPKKNSSHSDEEVIHWLNSKQHGSVLYVSFGSEVAPKNDELPELTSALEEVTNDTSFNFIWVIPSSSRYYPHGLDVKVGDRGLIINGWAPQLLILSHPSTGGFLSHCGWNSTTEAIGNGIPLLAWPIRGDQNYNAKMVAKHLKIGYLVIETGSSEMVKKDDILQGIGKLMGNVEVQKKTNLLKKQFEYGFPKSSVAALDTFKGFLDSEEQNV